MTETAQIVHFKLVWVMWILLKEFGGIDSKLCSKLIIRGPSFAEVTRYFVRKWPNDVDFGCARSEQRKVRNEYLNEPSSKECKISRTRPNVEQQLSQDNLPNVRTGYLSYLMRHNRHPLEFTFIEINLFYKLCLVL